MDQTTRSTKVCRRGHDLTIPENLKILPTQNRVRCRICCQLYDRRYKNNNVVHCNYVRYRRKLNLRIERKKQEILNLERILQDAAEVGHRNGAAENT